MSLRNIRIQGASKSFIRSMSRWNGEEFQVPVPWGRISGRQWGDPDGHPWIAAHGWLDNAGTFDPMGPHFPKGHRFYCIDFPGHGLSSHIPKGMMYNFAEGPTYLRRVARHFKLERYGLLGHSFGGAMSMLNAGMDPEPISHVISIDLIRPFTSEPKETVLSAMSTIKALFSMEEKAESISNKVYSYEAVAEKLVKSLNADNNLESQDMKEIAHILLKRGLRKSDCGTGFLLNRDPRHLVPTLQRLTLPHYKEQIKQINVPHLIIKANKSTFYGKEEEVMEIVQLLRENNPKFEYAVVDGIHHVHMNEPLRVLSLIKDFLEKFPV